MTLRYRKMHKLLRSLKICFSHKIPLVCGREGWKDTYDWLIDLGYPKSLALEEIQRMKAWYTKKMPGQLHWQKPANETNFYFDPDSGMIIVSQKVKSTRPVGRPKKENLLSNAERQANWRKRQKKRRGK